MTRPPMPLPPDSRGGMTSLADLLAAATPGPWKADQENICRTRKLDNGRIDYLIACRHHTQGLHWENDADARLISLCPELAAVAVAAERVKTRIGTPSPSYTSTFQPLYDALDALHARLQ